MWFSTFLVLNLFRRRARSLLTIGGMTIAIGTTVALLGIAKNLEQTMMQSFAGRGVDLIVSEERKLDPLTSDIPEDLAAKIHEVPGVEEVGPGLLELVNYTHDGAEMSLMLQGWEPGSFLFDDVVLKEGRQFNADENDVVVLGVNAADALEKQVGDTMTIQRKQYKVVGVIEPNSFQERGLAFLPLAELQRLMGRPNSVTGFSVRVARSPGVETSVDDVRKGINALTASDDVPVRIAAVPTAEFVQQSPHIQVSRAMAWATSLIALIVGAVGTLNTMLMSVVERLKEISILRAIGWKRTRVASMILGECFVLSIVGATLGIIGAGFLLRWLAYYPLTKMLIQGDMPPIVILEGLTVAAVVALFGGGYPAWRATQLTPVEGLSHE